MLRVISPFSSATRAAWMPASRNIWPKKHMPACSCSVRTFVEYAGGWKTIVVQADAGEKGFDFYALKDREMAREADYGFMLWDGRSKGTLNNVLNLLSANKRVLVFFAPEESFHTIRKAEDLSALLAKCGARALAIFEEKLDLSKRLGRSG